MKPPDPLVLLSLIFTGAATTFALVVGWPAWPLTAFYAWLGLDLLWWSFRTARLRRRS